jgi:DNA-binding transcriptional LysR family regulator
VFLAVAESKSRHRAVEYLAETFNESITPEGISHILRKIGKWLGDPVVEEDRRRRGVLELTARGRQFRRFAERIVASYEEIRNPPERRVLPKIVCLPHHVYIISQLECELREEHRRQTGEYDDRVLVAELAHSDRSDDEFEDRALFPLTLGHHDIAIGGPTTQRTDDLESTPLYQVALEAMVHSGYPRKTLSLTELVTEYRAMLPPEGARSRTLLESYIARNRLDDPGQARRVAAETYEILMSVQRVADDHRNFGPHVRRAVVAPADVALLYKPGSTFHGPLLADSTWVPIQHKGEPLALEVFATTVRPRTPTLRAIVDRIKAICERDPYLGAARAPVPRQRRAAGTAARPPS